MRSSTWKNWADSLKRNIHALYLATRDPRVPLLAKVVIGLVVAYALSPIDIIPDFIPIVGYLDDLILLPLGIWLAIRLIPPQVLKECRMLAARKALNLPRNRRAAAVIVVVWLVAAAGFAFWLASWTANSD